MVFRSFLGLLESERALGVRIFGFALVSCFWGFMRVLGSVSGLFGVSLFSLVLQIWS